GPTLPVDLAANAVSVVADVIRVRSIVQFCAAIARSRASDRTPAIHIETAPLAPAPDSDSWWDVPVAEVAQLDTTTAARKTYEAHKVDQRPLIGGNRQ